jgi:hypothetical protein
MALMPLGQTRLVGQMSCETDSATNTQNNTPLMKESRNMYVNEDVY